MLTNCIQGAYTTWLPASIDPAAPLWARVVAGALLVLALLGFARFREDVEPRIGVPVRFAENRLVRELTYELTPAICGLVVFASLLAALFASGFFDTRKPDLIFLSKPAIEQKVPLTPAAGRGAPAVQAASGAPAPVASEMVARGVWATTLGAIILSSLIVCWMASGIWRRSQPQGRLLPTAVFGLMALALVAVVTLLGKLGQLNAFGSEVSNEMLCGTWSRGDLWQLAPLTDGLNAIAIGVSIVVAGSFCLLIRAIRSLSASIPQRPANDAAAAIQDKFSSEWSAGVRNARHIQDLMDYVLYIGAAALIAGLLEVVATLSWSYAPFTGSSELKTQADLCKALQLPPSSHAAQGGLTVIQDLCYDAVKRLPHAETVDELRRFTRSLAIVFGASFSALLAAMYVPVAMTQQRLVALLAEQRPRGAKAVGAEGKRSGSELQDELELERSMVQRAFNVLAALGPLAVAMVSTVFGL